MLACLGKHFNPAGSAVISAANLAFTDNDLIASVDHVLLHSPDGIFQVERHAVRFSKTVDFITSCRWFRSVAAQHQGALPHFVRAPGT